VLTPDRRNQLIDALGEAQRIGMLGAGDVGVAVDQAARLAELIPAGASDFLDVGSGGGVPGLVIAQVRPDLQGVLVDRREKRVDLLVRLIGRLGLRDRVEAMACDVGDLPRRLPGRLWPVVTARGFGSPTYTVELVVPVLSPGGRLFVTEPPGSAGDRWRTPAEEHGIMLDGVVDGVAILRRPG